MLAGTVIQTTQSNKIINGALATLSVAVGIFTLVYLYNQTKLIKRQIKRHDADPNYKPEKVPDNKAS